MHVSIGTLRYITITAALLVQTSASAQPAGAQGAGLDLERRLFESVYESAERGEWDAVAGLAASERDALEDYVLWPDLRGAYLRANLKRAERREIETFLDRYGVLKPARELRYRYALELVRRGDLDAYHDIYASYYQGLNDAELDCLALQADISSGRGHRVAGRGRGLWLIGKSQVDECDPVFEFLKSTGQLTDADYRERYALAVKAREFSLARWLGRSIDEAHVREARLWLKAQSDPEKFLRSHTKLDDSAATHRQLAYAAERLTYRDPALALELFEAVQKRYRFSAELAGDTARHIALWTARDKLPNAHALLAKLDDGVRDDEVMRWRARTSLREQAWLRLLTDLADMSDEERSSDEWRYWRAIALGKIGQVNAAQSALERLASERGYYGFLAADELGEAYAFGHSALVVDEAALDELGKRPEFVRARELFHVGLDGRGRSEWDAAVADLSAQQKKAAAVLADRWGWHSRAISAAASVGQYDDLSLRYPLPFRSDFEQHAQTARISPTWAYGIARSESLFMRDIRSSAGAIGLMQLMPSTGRSIARELRLPYSGLDTLTDPIANIRLGTAYLGKMSDRYGGNRVLATAAYNAGPHRVDSWLPEDGAIDARIWVENIPYNETRRYVRRVMAADVIFQWRVDGTVRRLRDTLPLVIRNLDATADDQRVARLSR